MVRRLLVPSSALLWGLQLAFLSPALALILVDLYGATTAEVQRQFARGFDALSSWVAEIGWAQDFLHRQHESLRPVDYRSRMPADSVTNRELSELSCNPLC